MSEPVVSRFETPDELPPPVDAGRRLVGVQFRRAAAMIYDFDAGAFDLPHNTRVIVETERGEAIGWTVGQPELREPVVPDAPLRRVLRIANEADAALEKSHQTREKEALRFCAQRARQLSLPMKLVAVEWSHSNDKATFYFSSEERVDFRNLVRELAQRFRIRVEMRQITGRDEAKIIGAMGPCGRETCCSSWMRAFTPVSLKMAKDQGLAINPQKVMGVCGRLLCCLAYEQETYKELRRKLPRLGKQVMTPRGAAKVLDVLVLRGRVRVGLHEENAIAEFAADEVRPLGTPGPADEPETETDAPELAALNDAPAPKAEAPRRPEAPPRREQRPPQNRPETPPQGREARPPRPQQPPKDQPQAPRSDRPQQPQQQRPQQQQQRPQQQNRPPQQQRREQPKPPPKADAAPSMPKPAPPAGPEATPAANESQTRHRRRRRPHRGAGGGGGGEGSESE